jgi:hypothetical protein
MVTAAVINLPGDLVDPCAKVLFVRFHLPDLFIQLTYGFQVKSDHCGPFYRIELWTRDFFGFRTIRRDP